MALTGYSFRKKITIDNTKVDTTQTDFPVLIKLDNSNFDFSNAKSDGADIRFTESDGDTLIKFERLRHDDISELAEYYVKVPSVSDSVDTEIFIYYGNPSATDDEDAPNTWDSNYIGVWHFDDDASNTTVEDSTSNSNDGTSNNNTDTMSTAGNIYKAFDANGDYVDNGSGSPWNFGTGDFTISGWFKTSSIPSEKALVAKRAWISGTEDGYAIAFTSATNLRIHYNTDQDYTISNIADGQWHHVSVRFDYTNAESTVILDGVDQGTKSHTQDSQSNGSPFKIGSNEANLHWTGDMDAFKVSDTLRTIDYCEVLYESENDSLVSYGSQEALAVQIAETIIINGVEQIQSPTQNISENVIINDVVNTFSTNTEASFASSVAFTNPLIYVTDTNPAEIVKIDISVPASPVHEVRTLTGAKNAKAVAINSNTNFAYVACADGKVVKVDIDDLNIQTIIDLSDTDDLETMEALDAFNLAYTGTENTDAELYMIDEREVETLNTDFQFLRNRTTRIDTNLQFTQLATLETDFKFLQNNQVLLQTDFQFIPDEIEVVECNPLGRVDWHVFIDSVELVSTDLDLRSINISKTVGEKSEATFLLARRHDDLNTNLEGNNIAINAQNDVRIDIGTTTIFEGKISELNCLYQESTDQVEVRALSNSEGVFQFNNINLPLPSLDEQLSIYHILMQNPNIFNPALDDQDNNPDQFNGILADLGQIEKENLIRLSSFTDGGALAEDILDGAFNPKQNFTYFWFVRAGLITPEVSQTSTPNQGGNNLEDGFLPLIEFPTTEFPDFNINDNIFNPSYNDFVTSFAIQRYVGTSLSGLSSDLWDLISASYKYQRIYENDIDASIITEDFEGGGSTFTLEDNPTYGFSSVRTVLVNGLERDFTFTGLNQVNIPSGTNTNDTVKIAYGIRDFAVGTAPFRIISVRNGEFIPKETWVDKADGFYREKKDAFNFEEYVKEVVQLEYDKLTNINGSTFPNTSCEFTTTIDGFLHYNIKLLTRINVDNTTSPNIFKNNNGFPVSVKTININSGSMNVTLTCDNQKSEKELQEIDGQFPDEDDDRFNTEGYSIKVHTKFDMASREEVE